MRLHTERTSTGKRHSGIVALTDQRAPTAVVLECFTTLAARRSQEDMLNRFEFLLNHRD